MTFVLGQKYEFATWTIEGQGTSVQESTEMSVYAMGQRMGMGSIVACCSS